MPCKPMIFIIGDRIKYMFKRISFFNKFKSITNKEIRQYQERRIANGVSGATINREMELARTAYNRAIKNRIIKHN